MTAALVALRHVPLSIDEVVSHVLHAGAGAICVFLGTVRDHNEGAPVVTLEYEAYEAMAVAEMQRIVEEIGAEMPGVRLAIVHRSGALSVGEIAVVCGASSAHRDEAYRACRALIDRTKARVPIWKREFGPDGAHWIGWRDARCLEHDHDESEPHS
jgi:molybdopterin synthase catalytic subunit